MAPLQHILRAILLGMKEEDIHYEPINDNAEMALSQIVEKLRSLEQIERTIF